MTQHDPRNKPERPGLGPGQFDDISPETVDVSRIHMRIVAREELEPEEGLEPTPWWLWTFSIVLLFAMGFYIGRYGGSFSAAAHEVEEPQMAGAQAPVPVVKGDQVFAGVCQPCHQSHGMGIAGQYPPLAGSEWLVHDPETPVRIVLHGFAGPVNVKGLAFNNRMPAFSERLSNDEIAAVITYVRSSWGNNSPAVTASLVDSIRQQTAGRREWSAGELSSLRNPRSSK